MKKVGIFGLGKSGNASAVFFRDLGYDVYAWDDSAETVKNFNISNVLLLPDEKWPWHELESLILAPGIPLIFPAPHRVAQKAAEHSVEVICDLEILYRRAKEKSKFVAITGTNGKSTTTALIFHVLKECGVSAQLGGNIGIAALSLDIKQPSVFVLETSSYQLDLLKDTKFDVAVLLNITPDHIDRYGTFEAYVKSKKNIFANQTENDVAIICIDQDVTKEIALELEEGEENLVTYRTDGAILKNESFPLLPGEHNRQNIIATYFACKSLGVEEKKIIASIKTFAGLEHRMKKVFESENIRFVNDSKATNAEAAESALKTFNNIYWMAGGVPKQGGIKILEKYFPKIALACFYGQAAEEFAQTFRDAGYNNFKVFKTFAKAFNYTAKTALLSAKQMPVVLLSPACASFDEFNNYEERGRKFIELTIDFARKNNLVEK